MATVLAFLVRAYPLASKHLLLSSCCLPLVFIWHDGPIRFCHAEPPELTEGFVHSQETPSTSTYFPALPLQATITTKVKQEGSSTISDLERIMWTCGEKGCLCQVKVLVCMYENDGKIENFREKEWSLQNKSSSLTILPRKCFKIPSSRLAQTISIMHLMGLHFPSTLIGMLQALQLHLNEFMKWENSDKILAHMKQRGRGRQWGEEQHNKLTSAISKAAW